MKYLACLLFAVALAASGSCSFHYISNLDVRNNAATGHRLISISDDEKPTWKTESELMELKKTHTAFVDVTDVYEDWKDLPGRHSQNGRLAGANKISYPKPAFQEKLAPILANLSIPEMQGNLEHLTSYNNRYYQSATGVEASLWILNKTKEIIKNYGRSGDVKASLFPHAFPQSSIIARIEGKNSSGPLTILGCHMDSINLKDPFKGHAPGADDDGTGVVNNLEALRGLLAGGFKPATPVEIHWYAAEEVGLRGSSDVAKKYKARKVEIQAFMQMDMTAYFRPGSKEVIALLPDYVDNDLNEFVKTLVDEYNSIPWAMEEPCGYGCSDHFSWDKYGYPTTFPFEAVTGDYNEENMHTTKDTADVDGFSWDHALEFAKLSVAFVYELAASDWRKSK